MKKALILILLTLGVICLFTAFGCDNSQTPSDPPGHTCEWKSTYSYDGTKHYFECVDPTCDKMSGLENHEHVLNFDDSVTPFKATKECKCGHGYELDYTTATPLTAQQTLDNLYDGSIVQLTFGDYETLRISSKTDVIIIGDDFVTVKLVVVEGLCNNVMFYNVNFDFATDDANQANSGLNIASSSTINNFVVKNCKFTNSTGIRSEGNNTFGSVEIVNNQFLGLTWSHIDGNRTAIKVSNYNKLILSGNVFDGAMYDALQSGSSRSANVVTITNNVFKNIGHIVLHLYLSNSSSVNILDNVFYKEISTINPNVGLRAERGVYIYQGGNSSITLGVNTWEELPPNTDLYFHGVIIDMSAQLVLGE